MNDKKIEEQIDLNQEIQEEIKLCIKETFGDMLKFLGERNFKRWLNGQNIAKVAKETIYEVATEETDNYLKENKDVAGYHQRPVAGQKRKIVLKKEAKKDVLAHETFHAFVNGLGGFNAFYGEGITEFLSKILYNKKSYAYKGNVDTISLLYEMYGDRIIRDYLTQKGESFFKNIALDASNGKQESEIYKQMCKNDEIAEQAFMAYHKQQTNEKTPQELLKIGRMALVKNYFLYEKNKIQNFEYIKDGQVDVEKYLKDTSKVFVKAQLLNLDIQTISALYVESISELIENSHLLYGKQGEERENLKQQIKGDIGNKVNEIAKKYNEGKDISEAMKFDQQKEPYITCNKDQSLKMADTFLKKENFKEGTPFIEIMSRVSKIARATNMSERDLSYVLSKLTIELSGNPQNYLGIAEKYLTTVSDLKNLKKEYDENLEAVIYKRIDMECFKGQKTYVEKRDNTCSIISLDEETGKVQMVPLTRYSQMGENEIFVQKINQYNILRENVPEEMKEAFKQGQNVFRISNILDRTRENYISFSDDLVKMGAYKGKVFNNFLKFEQVEQDILNRIALSGIRKNIQKGKYSDFSRATEDLPDDLKHNIATTERIDFGPRFLKTDELISDYNQIKTLIPGIEGSMLEFRELCDMLVDKTFKIDTIPNNDKKAEYDNLITEYPDYKGEILDALTYIAKADKTVKERMIERKLEDIETAVDNINESVADAKPLTSRALYIPIKDKKFVNMQSLVKNALSEQDIRKGNVDKADQNQVKLEKEQHNVEGIGIEE